MERASSAVDCQHLQDDLITFAAGGLTDRARVEAHRRGCAPCTTEIEVLSAIVDTLALLVPDAIPPESLLDRVSRRAVENQRPCIFPPRLDPKSPISSRAIASRSWW
jgi:hypothetical protein